MLNALFIAFYQLFLGVYVGEPTRVLDFLFRGIALAKRYDIRSSSDGLMLSLDRAILYLLSRPIDSVQGIPVIVCSDS